MSLRTQFRVFHACMITMLGLVSTLFIQAYTSPIEDSILREGILTEKTFDIFVTASFIGAAISSLLVAPISEYLGIKSTLILFSPFAIIGGVSLVIANDSVIMILGRFLVGMYIGIPTSLVQIYVSEISPPAMKRVYGSLLSSSLRFGTLFCYLLGIWLNYRWLACVYILMIVVMISNLLLLPESPRWLDKKGWTERANLAREYYQLFEELDDDDNTTSQVNEQTLQSDVSRFLSWSILRPLLVCTTTRIYANISGHLLLVSYSAHILENGLNVDPTFVIFIYPLSQMIGCIMFIFFIRKIPWKWLLMVTTFVQMLCMGLLGLLFYLSIDKYNCSDMLVSNILCQFLQISPLPLVCIFGLSFSLGWGSIAWWLYGEIMNPHYIRLSAGLSTFASYFFEVCNQLIAPIIVEYFGAEVAFFISCIICLTALPIQWWY